MVRLLRHRQTKEPETDMPHLNTAPPLDSTCRARSHDTCFRVSPPLLRSAARTEANDRGEREREREDHQAGLRRRRDLDR